MNSAAKPVLSAACGAWTMPNGDKAHSHCTGRVHAGTGKCECPCHKGNAK